MIADKLIRATLGVVRVVPHLAYGSLASLFWSCSVVSSSWQDTNFSPRRSPAMDTVTPVLLIFSMVPSIASISLHSSPASTATAKPKCSVVPLLPEFLLLDLPPLLSTAASCTLLPSKPMSSAAALLPLPASSKEALLLLALERLDGKRRGLPGLDTGAAIFLIET